jgi:hypothetical protein
MVSRTAGYMILDHLYRASLGDLATMGNIVAHLRSEYGPRMGESGRKLLVGTIQWAGTHL